MAVTNPVTSPVVGTVTAVTSPVATALTPVVSPVVDTVNTVASPVTAVITPVVTNVTSPVTQVLAPVTSPVSQTVTTTAPTVTSPVTEGVAPVVPSVLSPLASPVAASLAPLTPGSASPSPSPTTSPSPASPAASPEAVPTATPTSPTSLSSPSPEASPSSPVPAASPRAAPITSPAASPSQLSPKSSPIPQGSGPVAALLSPILNPTSPVLTPLTISPSPVLSPVASPVVPTVPCPVVEGRAPALDTTTGLYSPGTSPVLSCSPPVSPELSPPPPPPGTVAVNVTGGTSGSSPIVTVNLSPPPPGTVAVNITGGTNGSSPTVTINATAGPASPGVSPAVEQSPPLASPLAPTGPGLSLPSPGGLLPRPPPGAVPSPSPGASLPGSLPSSGPGSSPGSSPGSPPSSPAASSVAPGDGMLWANITYYTLDGRVIDTSQPTFGDPYIIVYTVTNAAGLSASVRRTVEVADPCPAQFGTGWAYCTSTGACGLDGVCLTSPSYTKNTAPQIVLNTTILPATFNLTYSSNYTACAQGVLPSLAAPCEPGASANDRQDGNITSKVVACPSAGCKAIASLCTGQEFAKVGLQNCYINSSLPVGTVLQIPFLVWDNGHPALSARVNRTLVITAPCATGQFFCSGVCQQINCAAAAQVSQVYPPVLAYSTAATNLLGSKTVLYVQYGSAVPLNLQPCSSLDSQANCATVAWDRQDGDICGSIQVQPSASCAATQNIACATCPVVQLQQGLCIPDTYVLNYTVIDSLGLSAVPLQLEVIVYESAQVQASLQMISQIAYTGATARAQAHVNTARLTDASGSTANVAMRSAIATALTDWWANEYPENATAKAAQSNFGAVDAFAFGIVQPTDVTVINATFIANISIGTPGVFTYVSQAWIGIQANTSAFATNVNSSRRRLLEDSFLPAADANNLGTSAAAMSAVPLLEGPHRQLLQSAQGDISALETKLLALVSAFYGASPCNNTVVSEAYYGGRTPVLNGDRPFACVNYSVGASDNIDTYLSSNSANWASLPLFHILVMNNRPVIVRQSPAVDVDGILATENNYQTQQYAASQASWQQQLACLNASIVNKRQLHELTALVEASLAVESQIADSEIAIALYEQLLAISNDTVPLPYEQRQLLLDLQLSEEAFPARRSDLRVETVELRTLFFQLLQLTLDSCSSSCIREHPHAKFYFTVNHNQSLESPSPVTAPFASATAQSLLAADGDENATSVDLWFGYDVHYRAQPVQSNSGNFTPRYVGLRNQVLGGLYFQQEREVLTCRSRYQDLSSTCSETGYYNLTDAKDEISNLTTAAKQVFSTHETLPPLGHDPTFQPASRLWDYDLVAREGEYYNTSQASDETDSRGPRGFVQPVLGGGHSLKDYPTLITTQMSSHRAHDALTYLQDGQYIDADTKELYLTLATYNTIRTAFGYTTFTFTWKPSGDIQVAIHIATMPTVPYVDAREKAGFIAADVVLALLVAAFVISTLVGCARSLACTSCMDIFSTLWRRKVSMLLDCLTCAAMISSLLVYVAFAVLQCVGLQPEPYYSIYDSDNWAKARWFLLKRLGLAPGQSRTFTPEADFSIFNSTAISNVPGGYNRWRLPQDTSGMLGYVVLLEHLQRLMYLYHVFTILQTVSIVLLLVTFWRKWHIQPRIAMVAYTLRKALPDLYYIALTTLMTMPILAVLLCLFETHHDDGFFTYRGAIIFVYKLLIMNDYNGLSEGLHGGSELVQLNGLVTDSYLWAGPLAYAIKVVLTFFFVAAVLRPFRAQHRRALFAESQRATGLGSSIKHMLLDKWDNVFGRRSTTQEVVLFSRKTNDAQPSWWLEGQDANEGKSAAALLEPSSSDKWLASLRKSVSRALADFSRAATRGLLRILRSGSFSSNQARPDDPTKPTKGEMAKGIRLLIANARDDEELFNDLGRHWWEYSETMHEACGRLFTSRRKVLATLDSDKAHVLELIKEAQRFYENEQDATGLENNAVRSIDDVGDRHRRKTLHAIAAWARLLALRVTEQQRSKRTQNLQVASTITSSIITDMVSRAMRSGRMNRRRSVVLGADARGPLAAVTKMYTHIADAPTKTNLNGKVLARLRSTAGTNLLPQSGLARSSSSMSGKLQLGGTISSVPSIGRLGSMAAGPPKLNKLAGTVGLGAARRSADLPLQQLMGMQTPGTPRLGRTSSVVAPGMARRARRMSTVMTAQRVLPTEASALPLSALTIPEEGPYEVAGPGGLARATSGMRNLGDTGSSSLYRLGSLAALSPGFLGISAPAAPRRATADSDEGVPLGGLSKLASNVADLMTSLEQPRLQRPSASVDRLAAILSSNSTGQLLTPASTNAKTSPESVGVSPQAGAGAEAAVRPDDVRLTVSPNKRSGSALQKGGSLAALMEGAESEGSVTSNAGLLGVGGRSSSPTAQDRQPAGSPLGRTRRQSVINRRASQLMKKVTPKAALIQFTAQASAIVSDLSAQMGDLQQQQSQWQQDLQDQMSSVQELIDNIDV
ncbi:hypothetical protein WJX82_005420 [Trebouxia sp. C0006]